MYFECDELKERIHGQIVNSVKQLIKKNNNGKGSRRQRAAIALANGKKLTYM